jgi:DNA-binding FrmR family transcriptional regulator
LVLPSKTILFRLQILLQQRCRSEGFHGTLVWFVGACDDALNIGRGYGMGHLRSSKDNLLKRVKRIAGQIQAIERALDSDDDCSKTLLLVASTRGAINGLMDEIIEDHAREHVANPTLSNEERAKGVDELLEAIRRYSK